MKITRTFTIEKEILIDFDKISKQLSLNKSLFVENCIKDLINKNNKKTDINNDIDKRS